MTAIASPFATTLACWASRLSLFALSLVATGIGLHRFLGFPTPAAINLFLVALALAAMALLLAVVALVQVWRHGYEGARSAGLALVVAFGLFAWPAVYIPAYLSLPPINDITTDAANPPRFTALAGHRSKWANSVEYAGEAFARAQAQAYPDVHAILVNRSPEDAFAVVLETIERHLCDASVSMSALLNGEVVMAGRERRSFSPALRRALATRQRTCQFPGCDRPVAWCEGHHLLRWLLGGKTTVGNGVLVCAAHHRLLHEGGSRIEREGGDWVAISPGGERHRSVKAPPAA
jgi:hypothetical protein